MGLSVLPHSDIDQAVCELSREVARQSVTSGQLTQIMSLLRIKTPDGCWQPRCGVSWRHAALVCTSVIRSLLLFVDDPDTPEHEENVVAGLRTLWDVLHAPRPPPWCDVLRSRTALPNIGVLSQIAHTLGIPYFLWDGGVYRCVTGHTDKDLAFRLTSVRLSDMPPFTE